MQKDNWDAIFVGAGITSLACAAILVKKNSDLRLLIVDKHIVPGGYASVFKRPKVEAIFDCSLHKLSGMSEGGNLNRILEDLDLFDDLDLIYPPDYFCSCNDQEHLVLKNNADLMEEQLCQRFPHETDSIRLFFEQVRTYGRDGYYQFQMLNGTFEPNMEQLRYAHKNLKKVTVEEGLDQLFDDPYLKEILAAPGIYVGGYPEDLGYLYYLHVVYATLNRGNAYVKGASQHLSNVLVGRIEANGSKVLLSHHVNKILVEDDQVIGIESKKGNFYSNRVYINASPHYALDNLFEQNENLDAVKEKLTSLKPARSTTTLYVATDIAPEELGLKFTESMIFSKLLSKSGEFRKIAQASGYKESESEMAFWFNSPMEVTNYHLLDKEGGKVICLNILDSIEHWPKRRTPEYREKKSRASDIMLARLIEQFPQLKGHIVFKELSTPRTYVRFTNNTAGSGYGAMVGTDLSGHVFHHRFPIKGVDFVSAWVAGPSYEAAFGYAENKANKWSFV
ncbi:phytoene desaturase family protein [Alteromonas macleodii]|uniref:FAD-dependent oxidoreductase n=1 Tax=Alteromonas macleodii TaxID=28108 RepID=A0A6T9Y282_ALTMA|nr:NAD(P)/FAD-dependent oxidoreductase [Alteromonas macleodii]CAB9495203.1 FAD-dependent oxidoreductase [Alteromonas macleodii]